MIELNPTKNWTKFEGNKIPSSLELEPITFDYLQSNFKIVDIGCGFGKTVLELYQRGYKNIYGVDINENGIKFAKTRAHELDLNPHFSVGDANSLAFSENVFNFVINQAFWTTIISKRERIKIIKEIGRVLKKDGIIYIADFGQTWDHPHYNKVYSEGIEKELEVGTFEVLDRKTGEFKYFAHHYTKDEFEELLREGGFKGSSYYKQTIFTTQSGNKINGHVFLAIKN